MSTSLILGSVGAAIGGYFGGPTGAKIGFLIGSTIGALIDPPKHESPKLADLKLQRANYGSFIPYLWGRGRIAGTLIDQTDLVEHEGSSGGKGEPEEPTPTTYSASFMILLCKTPVFGQDAIGGVSRCWWNGRLIWDVDSGDACPFTVYVGSEDQLPDPTFEAIHGVGNQPAHRGYAYVTFTDFNLGDGGNQIGQFEFEVFTDAGPIPQRVSLFDPMTEPGAPGNTLLTMSTIDRDSVVTVGYVTSGDLMQETFALDGTAGDVGTIAAVPAFRVGVANLQAYWTYFTSDGDTVAGWVQDGELGPFYVGTGGVNPLGGSADQAVSVTGHSAVYSDTNRAVYSICDGAGSDVGIVKWVVEDGRVKNETSASVVVSTGGTPSNHTLATGNGSNVYCRVDEGTADGLREYDADLTLLRSWAYTEMPAGFTAALTFTVYNGLLVWSPVGAPNKIQVWRIEPGSAGFTQVGEMETADEVQSTSPIILLGGGPYALTAGGIIKLNSPGGAVPLSTIVGNLCDMTPSNAYNVDELTDDVRWFVVGANMTARNAIEALRPVFFFDGRESSDEIVFVKRGGAPVAEIPDADLCGSGEGSESDELLKTIRAKENDLPRLVSMTFIDVDSDYQPNVAASPRQTTESQQDVSIQVPVGLTAAEAAQKSWAIQMSEWIRRERFEWSTTLKWEALEPCDIAKVRGREILIETKDVTPEGVVTFSGVLSAPSIYTQTDYSDEDGFGGGGHIPQDPPRPLVPTQLVLLDIPLAGFPFGFWAAMGPRSDDGRWPGAELYKSVDDGVTWVKVAETREAAIIGETDDESVSPGYDGVLDVWTDDTVDETTLLVDLTSAESELSSTNATGLANGQNKCAIASGDGWEIAAFRDAVQIDETRWALTGWRRGLFGTMSKTGGHAVGDTFVMLPCTNVDAPESDLNVELKYKAVTLGMSIAGASTHLFTNTGESTDGGDDDGDGGTFGQAAKHFPIKRKTISTSTYTLTEDDRAFILVFDAACTVTLPNDLPRWWWAYMTCVGGSADLEVDTVSPAPLLDADSATLSLTDGQGIFIEFDGADYWTMRGMGSGGGGGSTVGVKDEGSTVVAAATFIDFQGPGVTAGPSGAGAAVAIQGTIHTMDGGADVDTDATVLNFNTPLSAADAGAGVTNVTLDDSGVTPGSYANATLTVTSKGVISAIASGGVTVTARNIGGSGQDGNLTASAGTTTLTRNTFYDTVTLSGTAKINTNGWLLFIKTCDLTNAGAGAINNDGPNGGNASNLTGGAQPAGNTSAVFAALNQGSAGGNGTANAGVTAGIVSSTARANGGGSNAAGKGGNGSVGSGGSSRAGAAPNSPLPVGFFSPLPVNTSGTGLLQNSGGVGGPGGSGGGGDNAGHGGGGGGGGGTGGGGMGLFIDELIVNSSTTAAGAIRVKGGDAGTAANGTAGFNTGGGGGGSGGGGGWAYVGVRNITGTCANLINADGGIGTNGGNGAGTGTNGDGGRGGDSGTINFWNIGAGTHTYVSVSAGSANSGQTAGGAGTARVSV